MTLEVYQLQDATYRQKPRENAPRADNTHLGPRQIWSDDELDISMTEDAKHHAPEIPLMKT